MSPTSEQVIAIAGAGGGLGSDVAARFAADGAKLALCGRDPDRLAAVASDLGLPGDRVDVHTADLLDQAAATRWHEAVTERFGSVDGLVHLVGGWKGGEPIAETPLADYDWLHDHLLRTVQHTTRAFHNSLAASERGRFVLVSSAQAQAPSAANASYAAAKAAAEAWTLALADSLGETRSTANIVVVNAILTEQMREANPNKAYATFTATEDIAEAIALLCSDAGQKMNGKRLSLHP